MLVTHPHLLGEIIIEKKARVNNVVYVLTMKHYCSFLIIAPLLFLSSRPLRGEQKKSEGGFVKRMYWNKK